MVAATVTMAGCDGLAAPISSVACIQAEGSDSAPQCVEGKGLLPAQVYYQPYRPGTTYISDGRGCAIVTAPPSSNVSVSRSVNGDTLGRGFRIRLNPFTSTIVSR